MNFYDIGALKWAPHETRRGRTQIGTKTKVDISFMVFMKGVFFLHIVKLSAM